MFKAFVSLLLISLLFLSSIGLTIYRVKDPAFFSEQIKDANLYGRLTETLPKLLEDKMFEDSDFTKDDLVDVVTKAIDGPTFYAFAESASAAYLPWLTSEKSTLDFRFDLTGAKANLHSSAVDRLNAKYNQLATCNAQQVKAWSADEGLPACQLPSSNVRSNDVTRLFGEQVDKLIKPIPSELVGVETAKLQNVRAKVTSSLRVIQMLWIATLLAFFLFLVILRRNAFLSLAFIFLLTGLIEAVFGLIAWDWVGKLVIDSMPAGANGVLPVAIEVVTAGLDVLKSALSGFSVVLIIVGAAFLFFWIFFRPKPKRLAVPAQ